jgi:hypothetical protein
LSKSFFFLLLEVAQQTIKADFGGWQRANQFASQPAVAWKQGDQVRRIFALWAIVVYSGSLFL